LATVEGGRAAVTHGLQAGERVVVDGQSRLTPGAKVKVRDPKSPGTAKPPTP
jgi:multidrug efflux system membrane fusion protein